MKKFFFIIILSLIFGGTSNAKNSNDVSNKKVYLKLFNKENKKKQWQLVDEKDGYPVRDGKKSWRFELQKGWCGEEKKWSDCENNRQRSEIATKEGTKISNKPFWMSVSIYLPEDYQSLNGVSVSWWQVYQTGKNPIIMLRERDGFVSLDMMPSGITEKSFFVTNDVNELKGKWTDFKFNIRLHPDEGFVKMYVNNVLKDEWNSGTISRLKSKKMTYRMDTGIYHTYVNYHQGEYNTQVIYVDAFRHSKKEEKVGPRL